MKIWQKAAFIIVLVLFVSASIVISLLSISRPTYKFTQESVEDGGAADGWMFYAFNGNAGSKVCYTIATAVYGSYDCPEVWTLRRFRDDTLSLTWYGRLFIALYYLVSPTIVRWFGGKLWFNKIWKAKLDRVVQKLHLAGYADTPYRDKV